MSGRVSSISPVSSSLSPYCPIRTLQKIGRCIAELIRRILQPIAAYFLKICVFRDAALQGRCSKACMTPFARFVINTWMWCQKIPERLPPFNAQRLEKSAGFLAEFGEVRQLQTSDNVTIDWALYTPERFNKWIEGQGGYRDGEFIRPRNPDDWHTLLKLEQFRWFEKIERGFRIPENCALYNTHAFNQLIEKNGGVRKGEWILPRTESDWAALEKLCSSFERREPAFRVPRLVPGAGEKCILRCQGFGRKIPMDKAMIALHLAAGFNYAVFDWREEISANGFFEDAEAVYQALRQHGFAPQQIKAMGSCRATFVLSRLKELHHHEGLDVVLIHPPTSLRSTIERQSWLARQIGLYGLPAIEKDGAHFDTLRRLESLQPADSRTCLIMSEGDETVAPDTLEKLTAAAQRIGPCDVIIEPRAGREHDPHFDEPLRNPVVLDRYLKFLEG